MIEHGLDQSANSVCQKRLSPTFRSVNIGDDDADSYMEVAYKETKHDQVNSGRREKDDNSELVTSELNVETVGQNLNSEAGSKSVTGNKPIVIPSNKSRTTHRSISMDSTEMVQVSQPKSSLDSLFFTDSGSKKYCVQRQRSEDRSSKSAVNIIDITQPEHVQANSLVESDELILSQSPRVSHMSPLECINDITTVEPVQSRRSRTSSTSVSDATGQDSGILVCY